MEWKIADNIQGDAFDERWQHSSFQLSTAPTDTKHTFYVFGGSTKSKLGIETKLNDVIEFSSRDGSTWKTTMVSKGTMHKSSSLGNLFVKKENVAKSPTKEREEKYPAPRCCHTTAVLRTTEDIVESGKKPKITEEVVLFGGFDGKNYFNDVWILDTKKWSWRQITSDQKQIPSPRCWHTSVIYNEQMWVLGGYNGKTTLDDFWVFDFETQVPSIYSVTHL
jgi:hypothetical protein